MPLKQACLSRTCVPPLAPDAVGMPREWLPELLYVRHSVAARVRRRLPALGCDVRSLSLRVKASDFAALEIDPERLLRDTILAGT